MYEALENLNIGNDYYLSELGSCHKGSFSSLYFILANWKERQLRKTSIVAKQYYYIKIHTLDTYNE